MTDEDVPRGLYQKTKARKGGQHDRFPRRVTMKKCFGPRELDLAANDVILALENSCSREEALKVARSVLEGYGHIFKPNTPRRKHEKIRRFEGGLPRIGLTRETGETKGPPHPFPWAKREARRIRKGEKG